MVLLHCCCAPCSAAIIEWMMNNDIIPTLYYYNPNIYPQEEYLIRKNELTCYATELGLTVIDDDYDHQQWEDWVCHSLGTSELQDFPERGPRCLECFKMRLLATARKCQELGIERFTTTLASSRWKSLDQINAAGQWAAEMVNGERFTVNGEQPMVTFWDKNWRKGGLQDRRNALLKENNFYNQLYCGCEFSQRQNLQKIQKEGDNSCID